MFFVLVRNIDNAMQCKKLCKIARALNSTAISKYVTLKMTDVPSKHAWKIKKLKKVVMFIRISFCLSQGNVYSISSGNIETNCYPRFSLSFIVARRSRSLICCVILLFTYWRLDSLFLTGFFRIRAFLSKTSRNIIFQQIRIPSTTFLRFRGSQVFFFFFYLKS